MPTGGGYDGSDLTKNLLHGACNLTDGKIRVNANQAKPSFCSGATYLVLLKASLMLMARFKLELVLLLPMELRVCQGIVFLQTKILECIAPQLTNLV